MQISLQRVAIKSAQQEKERGREGEQLQHKAELESDTQTQVDKKLICIKKRDKKREWVVKVKGVEPRGKLTPWTLTRRRLISIKLKKTHGEFWCCLTVWLPAWLCWQLAAKFNELRQVVSLTQIKIMLMNEPRAREREGDCLPAQPNHGQGRRQRPFRPVRFSFCLMSARLRRGGNANPDRDSASLLPRPRPLPVLRPLLLLLLQRRLSLISQSRFSHISALPSISATQNFSSPCLIFVFHFSLCTALIWWRHSAALSLARPISLCFRGSTSASLCALLLSTSSPLSLPPAVSAFA